MTAAAATSGTPLRRSVTPLFEGEIRRQIEVARDILRGARESADDSLMAVAHTRIASLVAIARRNGLSIRGEDVDQIDLTDLDED